MRDIAYQDLPRSVPQIDHAYGDHVHILNDVMALSMLARLGHPETRQPDVNRLLMRLYTSLFGAAVNLLFPRTLAVVRTRMERMVPGAAYQGQIVDPKTRVVLVGVARAGTLPAYEGFELLNDLVEVTGVRVDHIYMQRRTDQHGRVIGVDLGGSKFGGDVDRSVVLLPDPMGATGSSMSDAVGLIKSLPGVPLCIASLHLIITPEFIDRVRRDHPDVHIFALRLDRGLSDLAVLSRRPGETKGEVGINEVQYIVPGAGGLGELINNSDA